MAKVIVERPRRGGGWSRKGRVPSDPDLLPKRAGIKPKDASKTLNENLAPLRRYIARQVNRPWNKVYSEISANLRPTSTVQQHVRDHIRDFVAEGIEERDGVAWVKTRWGDPRPLDRCHSEFYVHPRTGLLRRNPHYRSWGRDTKADKAARAKEAHARRRDVGPKTQLHLLSDGAWWEVRLANVPGEGTGPWTAGWRGAVSVTAGDAEDVVLRAGLSTLSRAELYGRWGARAHSKRQLSKADMKKRGLR